MLNFILQLKNGILHSVQFNAYLPVHNFLKINVGKENTKGNFLRLMNANKHTSHFVVHYRKSKTVTKDLGESIKPVSMGIMKIIRDSKAGVSKLPNF